MNEIKSEKEKDQKIKELEELIEKMKKEHLEELNKIKYEKNLENTYSDNKKEKNENIENENKEKKEINYKIDNLENMVKDLFNRHKKEFLNEIIIFKKEILSKMKEELNDDVNINNDNLNDIIININDINSNLKDNFSSINNIETDIVKIKEKIKNIENINAKEFHRDNIIENKINDNKIDNNKDNQYMINQFNNANNIQPLMNINKVYKCTNCNNCYILNDCFNILENKNYKEHSLKLQDLTKNNNNESNYIKNNINDENNKNNNPKINIIEDYIYDKNKKKVEFKEDNKIIKKINNINRIFDEEEEGDEENIEIEMEINQVLSDFFYKEGKLKLEVPIPKELNNIKSVYLSLLKKNIEINNIQNLQNNYISVYVYPNMNKLINKQQNIIKNRIGKLRDIINKDLKNNY